jgi:UDP-3-O-[3-hydroxymyristoyl] glucosamine N-acyltransferase
LSESPVPTPGAPIRLADLARVLGLEVEGDSDVLLSGVAPVAEAQPGDLTFLRSPAFAEALAASRASAVVTLPDLDVGGRPALRSDDPSRDFYRAAALLVPEPRPAAGVHASVFVAPGATIHETAAIGPGCCVGAGARIGARSVLHGGVVLGDGVRVGEDCELHANVVLRAASVLGDRVTLQPGVVIGGEGFGYVGDGEGGLRRVHNIGSVSVGDDVEVGANATIDRGTLGDTRIGRGCKIDNLVQIGHNCVLGEHVVVIAQVGIAGSTRIGDRTVIMGQAGLAGHLEIGAGAFIGPMTGVHKNLSPGERVLGAPQRSERAFHKEMAALKRLPELLRRVRRLEASDESEE